MPRAKLLVILNVKCCYCDTAFRGGTTRIGADLLGGIGIAKCKQSTAEVECALK